MASNESNSLEDQLQIQQDAANMPTEEINQTDLELEREAPANTSTTDTSNGPQRSSSYRGVRLSHSTEEDDEDIDDSWWSEVENGDLLLDQIPNVTSVFTPSPEAIMEQKLSPEDESVLEENFDRLHKIADKIKMTLNEHAKNKEIEEKAEQAERERKLSESSDKENNKTTGYSKHDQSETDCAAATALLTSHKEQSLEEFKEELRSKRLQRQGAVQDLRDEIGLLRKQLDMERDISRRLRNGEKVEEITYVVTASAPITFTKEASLGACALPPSKCDSSNADDIDDVDPFSRSRHANIELANAQLALQMANSENISLRGELAVVQKQVITLKEVIACCKQMLAVKEEQCSELKQRLTEIEKSFAEHEMKIMSDNLRQEYERQLVNIRQLRQLYEERQRVAAAEYENLQRLISIKRDELAQEQEKSKSLEERNQNLMKEIETANNELACLRDECKEHKFEKTTLKEEIGAVNTLFSQMVMGFNGKNNLDIDRLTTMLEENRTLLNDMATKECTDGATLPKLLFELVEQATTGDDEENKKATTAAATPSSPIKLGKEEEENDVATLSKTPENDEQTTSTTKAQLGEKVVELEALAAAAGQNNIATENVNENMASLTLNDRTQEDEIPTSSVSPSSSSTKESTTACFASSHSGNDDEDEDDDENASNPDDKVIVATTTQNKLKKHHRKMANNKKSSTSIAATAASATAATMKFHDSEVIGKVTSAQEIIGNLPKVWRVLMELLSHHKIDPVQFEENGKGEDCYKSVETPNGPKAELSVSKTYIKLKDLILEKKSLVKETNRLKTLNCHLDYRLNEQEKRLSAVSLELTKTWHLVGKMQRQHRQLHTQEQILRYQLQQKRRLLSELKDELEYCRRKWAAARAKNDESQEQCNDLRREFARRKLEDANNSAESGYSDSGGQASDEEVNMVVVAAAAEGAAGGEEGITQKESLVNYGADDDDDNLHDSKLASASAAGGCVNYRRKRLREMFEHARKIKRMQSTSPGRQDTEEQTEMVVLRWNSAPPTCGWRYIEGISDEGVDEVDGLPSKNTASTSNTSSSSTGGRGAIPKSITRTSRKTKRHSADKMDDKEVADDNEKEEALPSEDRAGRIYRLEEQCKTLIQQVLETSDNRERLEVQLKRFQDEMSPVQYAVPLEELINKKRIERMTRASSLPLTGSGSLTPREEEYTRKRSERLERLEEESRQLMSRIKRTSDRGHYLRCSLDRIRRAPVSREGSFESNTEEDFPKPEEDEPSSSNTSNDNSQTETNPHTSSTNSKTSPSPLTAEEEAYTARRAARLQRLEEESKQLLTKLSKNSQKGDNITNKLDTLHERYKSQDEITENVTTSGMATSIPTPASTSTTTSAPGKMSIEQRIENIDKISSNREERLRILEEEGRQLINRLSQNSERGTKMINRIAERELIRQQRSKSTPVRDNGGDVNKDNDVEASTSATASAILPTPKNVACSSIVSEELTDRVIITTIPSQIAAHQGAIPKSKPTTQLLASRPKSARLQKTENKKTDNAHETLEDMIKRLQSLPFPGKEINTEEERREETENKENNEDISEPKTEIEREEIEKSGEHEVVPDNKIPTEPDTDSNSENKSGNDQTPENDNKTPANVETNCESNQDPANQTPLQLHEIAKGEFTTLTEQLQELVEPTKLVATSAQVEEVAEPSESTSTSENAVEQDSATKQV